MNQRLFTPMLIAVLLAAGVSTGAGKDRPDSRGGAATIERAAFRKEMRRLWEDHITWTRLYIVSALADLPDKDATAGRLLQNQTDIGNAVKALYGDGAGNQLTALLRDHILFAADLIARVRTGDTVKSKQATLLWYANADSLAKFLSDANPSQWPYSEMKSMMHDHLRLTTAEVVARLSNDWAGDIGAYEKVHGQILAMADMLSDGLIAQFPARFR